MMVCGVVATEGRAHVNCDTDCKLALPQQVSHLASRQHLVVSVLDWLIMDDPSLQARRNASDRA